MAIVEINVDSDGDKILRSSFFFPPSLSLRLFTNSFLLTVETLKNETPVHDRVTPENIRSEVIRTTCSAR